MTYDEFKRNEASLENWTFGQINKTFHSILLIHVRRRPRFFFDYLSTFRFWLFHETFPRAQNNVFLKPIFMNDFVYLFLFCRHFHELIKLLKKNYENLAT